MAESPQAGGARRGFTQPLGHLKGGAGDPLGLLHIHVQQAQHFVVEVAYALRTPQVRASLQQLPAPPRVRLLRKFRQQLVQHRGRVRGQGHQKPFSSKSFFKRLRQRPRMNPMEPAASLQAPRHLLVRHGRLLEKQQRDHLPAARRQAGHRLAHHLLPLDLLQHGGRDGVHVAQLVHVIRVQIARLFEPAPPPVITLVGGHPDQPSLQGFGIAQPWQFVKQIQADRLENIGRVLVRRAVAERDRIDQALVAIQQSAPRALVAGQAIRDQARIAPFRRRLVHWRAPAPARQYSCSIFQRVYGSMAAG